MTLKTAKDVIAVAKARGFEIHVRPGPPPMPVLHCPGNVPKSLATETLLNALRAWRLEIIDELTRDGVA